MTHSPTPLSDYFISLLKLSHFFAFSADDFASCILKMKAIRRNFLISFCIYTHTSCIFFYAMNMGSIHLAFLWSRTLHCLSIHPRLLPASELRHPCLPFLLDHSCLCRDMLNYLLSLKQTNLPQHHIFLIYGHQSSVSLLDPLHSVFFFFFFFYLLFFFTLTTLVEVTNDLLGDIFPSQFSVLILLM